jgi:hypothetical protein
MRHLCRTLTIVAVLGLGASGAAVAPASNGPSPAAVPVIGKPVSVPAQPVAESRFSVSFRVTRSDTHALVRSGTMTCEPSVAAKPIRHEESFRNGTARLSFLVPASAAGKRLTVKLAVSAAGGTAARLARFLVQPAPVPTVSIGDASADEGNGGTTGLSFPVTLAAPSTHVVSVAFATADGTATTPSDYVSASGTLVFSPGETAKAVTVDVVPDIALELDETFTVVLSSPVKTTISKDTATGTIVGDEVQFIAPSANAVIPQNDPTIGCPAASTYGAGFAISFAWKVRLRDGVQAVELLAQRRGAPLAMVHERIGDLDQGSLTFRSCGSFVVDANLAGWYWAIRLIDAQGNAGAWAESPFGFAPCRLDGGAACNAPPR